MNEVFEGQQPMSLVEAINSPNKTASNRKFKREGLLHALNRIRRSAAKRQKPSHLPIIVVVDDVDDRGFRSEESLSKGREVATTPYLSVAFEVVAENPTSWGAVVVLGGQFNSENAAFIAMCKQEFNSLGCPIYFEIDNSEKLSELLAA